MNRTYTGIGSRQTPPRVLARMRRLATRLGDAGYTLRSGHAPGADYAFEQGLLPHHLREIFLPKPGWTANDRLVPPAPLKDPGYISDIPEEAFRMAREFHPYGNRLGQYTLSLMARNAQQILGPNLDSPTSRVFFWAPSYGFKPYNEVTFEYEPNKFYTGGTTQALRMAKAYGIPMQRIDDTPSSDERVLAILQELLA